MKKPLPDFSLESRYPGIVAGVDEVGCGPLAGPVVAAAVILRPESAPGGINDSKKLTALARERIYAQLHACAIIGVGMASVEEIDRINIRQAALLAMERAVDALQVIPDAVLVDGPLKPNLRCACEPVIRGDSISISIAAASIIAKVERDRIMTKLHDAFPHFGWKNNAGYGTAEHMRAMGEAGVTPHHRRSFAPVKKLLELA